MGIGPHEGFSVPGIGWFQGHVGDWQSCGHAILSAMPKTKTLLAIAAVIAPALAVAQETSFPVADGTGHRLERELPPRFLVSFEFMDQSSRGSAIVGLDGEELFDTDARDSWQSAQIAVNSETGIYSSWLGSKPLLEEKKFGAAKPKEVRGGGEVWRSSAADGKKIYNLGGDFTVAARFRTRGNGSIVAKCAPEGEWTEDSKVLFLRNGNLVYDIGWLGAVRTKKRVNDGEWHNVVLTFGEGKVRIWIDGKLEAEKNSFTRPDPGGSVLKIGEAATDFGGRYDGEIDYVRFWKRALPKNEIAALGKGEEAKTNTPLLNWKRSGEGAAEKDDKKAGRGLRFSAKGGTVNYRNVRVELLAEVDHARLIRSWDHLSLERGARIYNGLCITCHGDQKIEGTLPTALRFHQGEFKNGKDPLAMYNTLTKGFNQMVAQPWMTPTQKYDVIHYIRETFIKRDNPKQFVKVDDAYLAGLPKGIGVGSTEATLFADNKAPKYKKMDFGPVLFWTLEAAPGNIAYKGIAVRLDEGPGGISRGNKWMLYDHDTMRVAAAWTGDKFVNWRGIAFDQSHGSHTAIVGDVAFTNPVGAGWGRPGDGSFEEVRFRGRDNKPYGPLPREWAHYKGLYLHGNRAVIHYTVGDAEIHETPGYEMLGDKTIFTRTMNIGRSSSDLLLRIAPKDTAAVVKGEGVLTEADGFHVLKIAAATTPIDLKVLAADVDHAELIDYAATSGVPIKLESLLAGGHKRWPGIIQTDGKMGGDERAFEVDEIELPWDDRSPWNSWMRLGGFDFFEDGKRAAVATWLGDVWIVDGLGGKFEKHNWQRIATGLFQPLGVKIVGGTIYVSCRDQIAELHDKNGDGEIDYVRNFNNDHQVTEHFHEFAMGLQTDAENNFYYAKSARHAKTALVAHHGTLLKVSADGSRTEILATGFRAANGVCLNPDGSYIVTDQEGHWNPKNRINWVKKGGFYGNMFGYHDVTDDSDEAMDPPLCWITNRFDRSPGELMWVPQEAKWGSLNGSLLNLSYGAGRVYLVPHEKLPDGRVQGGMISLGMDFPTGIMRGRFHPDDGQLYTTGMFAWAGNKRQDGGFYRIRCTGEPANLPVGLKAVKGGMILQFSDKLDPASAASAGSYKIKVWGLKRTKSYGSPHVDERPLKVAGAQLQKDGKSVLIGLHDLGPTWCMEIQYKLKAADGAEFSGTIHNTIHALGE